jgi:hypothetical protein
MVSSGCVDVLIFYVRFRDLSDKGTASNHVKSQKKCYGDPGNDKMSVQRSMICTQNVETHQGQKKGQTD